LEPFSWRSANAPAAESPAQPAKIGVATVISYSDRAGPADTSDPAGSTSGPQRDAASDRPVETAVSLRDHPLPPPPDPEPTDDPTGGNTPVPAGEGGNTPTPVGEGGNDPVPVGEGGNDPVPVGEGGNDPVPVGEGGNDPTPIEEGNDPTPVDEGGNDPTPVDDGGSPPVPAILTVENPHTPQAYPIVDDPNAATSIGLEWLAPGDRGRPSEPWLDLGRDGRISEAGGAGPADHPGAAISYTTGDSDRGEARRPSYDLDL